jgi:putative membrane protein
VVAAVVFLAFRVMAAPGQHSRGRGDDGLRILNERYARGEINRDEYEERRRTLQTGRA